MARKTPPARIKQRADTRRQAAPSTRSTRKPLHPCAQERQTVMRTLESVLTLLGGMLGDNVEVVLHDLTTPSKSTVAIAHGHISGRTKGDPILAGPKGDAGFAAARLDVDASGEQNSIVANYRTVTKSGVVLSSATAIFRDASGTPFAALCLNSDMTVAHMAHAWLGSLLGNGSKARDDQREPAKMTGMMEDIISHALDTGGKPVSMLTKEERLSAVASMQSSGLFIVRGGASRAAEALGVTRFTIYNYLDELKQRSTP